MSDTLESVLATALKSREALIAQLQAEHTNAYRLFHGTVEGRPGLSVDQYGTLLLVQTFHEPLTPEQLAELTAFYAKALPGMTMVYNDRSQQNSRISNPLSADQLAVASIQHEIEELGVKYCIQGRHEGQDPWLFLDMRAGRRRVMQEAAGKSVLNHIRLHLRHRYCCRQSRRAACGQRGFLRHQSGDWKASQRADQ